MDPVVEEIAQEVMPIEGDFDPASEEEVAAAEAKLGVKLPSILRDLQTRFGRCMFAGEALVNAGEEPLGIFTLFGCKGSVGNLVSDFEAHPDMKAEGLIPFADDMFNNRYVWRSEQGDVLFIDYANRQPPCSVAGSLEDFFRKLEVIPD